MKTLCIFAVLAVVLFFGSSSFIIKSSNGIAGYTGAPNELTCSGGGSCHKGGVATAQSISISAVPSFSANQYMADSIYQITISVAATGFSWYGFGCEILDSLFLNAGTISQPGLGVKLLNSSLARRNAVHSTAKFGSSGVDFTFRWTAPSSGRVNFYFCGNAVNHNGNTSGDLPIPGYAALYPAPVAPEDTVTNPVSIIKIPKAQINAVTIFPNPMRDFGNISYSLIEGGTVSVELISLQGSKIKELFSLRQEAGTYSQIINVSEQKSGAYFVRVRFNGHQTSQKLISIHNF